MSQSSRTGLAGTTRRCSARLRRDRAVPSMIRKAFMVPAVFGLFAAPMLIGVAGTDALAGHWDRVERSAVRLVSSPAAADDDTNALATYQQALKVLRDEFYPDQLTPAKSRELTYAAIRGMLLTLNDPFTSFLDGDEWNSMQQTTR